MPCSSIRFTIIGTAVKIPIWNRNWVLSAACSEAFPNMSLFSFKAASTPERAWIPIEPIVSTCDHVRETLKCRAQQGKEEAIVFTIQIST